VTNAWLFKTSRLSNVHRSPGSYRISPAAEYGPRLVGPKLDDSPEVLPWLGRKAQSLNLQSAAYRPSVRSKHRDRSSDHLRSHLRCRIRQGLRSDLGRGPLCPGSASSMDGQRGELWAITQLPPRGTAILPVGDDGWGTPPQWSSPTTAPALLRSRAPAPPFRRLSRLENSRLLIEHVGPAEDREHPKLGAVRQVFVNQRFCELEHTGQIAQLDREENTRQRVVWEVAQNPDADSAVEQDLERGP